MQFRIHDFLDLAPVKTSGKRTQVYEANLVKAGSILPYYMGGKVVWMWKDPEHWLTDNVRDQFENLVICDEHQNGDVSHTAPIGLVRDVRLADPFVAGVCSIFRPDAIASIQDGTNQLSPDATVQMVPIGREIGGVWVDYAQCNPVLDHIAKVERGRQGEELSLRLQSIKDSAQDFDSIAFEISMEQARHTIRLSDQIDPEPTMKTAEELQLELTATTTQLGAATQSAIAMKDERDAAIAERDTATAELTTLQASDTAADAVTLATEGMALFNAATGLGLTVEMKDCITTPIVIYRQIKDTIAPGSDSISDEMLPMFCAGMLTARNANTVTPAAPAAVEKVAIADAAQAPATFSLADSLRAAGGQTSNVEAPKDAATTVAKAFRLPNPMADIKAPSFIAS